MDEKRLGFNIKETLPYYINATGIIINQTKFCKSKRIHFNTSIRNSNVSIPVTTVSQRITEHTKLKFFIEMKVSDVIRSKKYFHPQNIIVNNRKAIIGAVMKVLHEEDLTAYMNKEY